MRIQRLYKQAWGYRRITAAYSEKQWKRYSVKDICERVAVTSSAAKRKVGSGLPRSVHSNVNIEKVSDMICLQEEQRRTGKSVREIAAEIGISHTSVINIAKHDLGLSSFKQKPVQALNADAKQKRSLRCKALLRHLSVAKCKRMFFTDEKVFYVNPPRNSQK